MEQDYPWVGPVTGCHARLTVLPHSRELASPFGIASVTVPPCGRLVTCAHHATPRKLRRQWLPYWKRPAMGHAAPAGATVRTLLTWGPEGSGL